ncbi:Uncharacterized membrane protein YccC [Verrucomicrobium sp. GAS474]|uniref:FUSC family protein n=1 Tax=Verrucomicrobium sp. GAS474 TaxID=1882831 RepID=UPI00087A0120|nr:FUSC family protein [Verrucomicrobium sp. GAS474]SDT95250.1 Uncharacterized membrane protein YccC [Verrucomicrobium sp. GAS474]
MPPGRPAFLFQPIPGAYGFAARTALSAVGALYAAYALQLESPYWAATTALIVANPVYGQIVSKSLYRLAGTVVGGAVSVALAGLFAQTPELFLLALALWVGLCLGVASLLRNFASYGAILAGYSTAIIALAVVPQSPLQTFDIAMARGAAIFVGIASAALVAGLLKPGGASRNMELRVRWLFGEAAALLGELREGDVMTGLKPRRRSLAGEVLKLDSLVTFAASESERVRNQREELFGVAAALLHAVTGLGGVLFSLHHLRQLPAGEQAAASARATTALEEAEAAALDLAHFAEGGPLPDYGPARERLVALAFRAREEGATPALPIFIHRLRETLEALQTAAEAWADWRSGRAIDPALRAGLDFHRDLPGAIRTGVYGMAAVLLSGGFWIATAWSSGATMVTMTIIACCLAWVQKTPEAFVRAFFIGTLIAVPICGLLLFGLMAKVEGFVPLAVILGLPVAVGALAMSSTAPTVAGIGTIFLTLIMTLTAPRNPMSYDFGGFLENAFATAAGILFAWVCALLLRSPDPRRRAGRCIRNVCGEVEALASARNRDLPSRAVWESRTYHRLLESMPHLETREEETRVLDSAFAALQIGASVIDLRHLAAAGAEEEAAPRWREAIDGALDRLRHLGTDAGEAAEGARRVAAFLLEGLPPAENGSREKLFRVRTAASLEGIWLLLADQEEVFHRVRQEAMTGVRS